MKVKVLIWACIFFTLGLWVPLLRFILFRTDIGPDYMGLITSSASVFITLGALTVLLSNPGTKLCLLVIGLLLLEVLGLEPRLGFSGYWPVVVALSIPLLLTTHFFLCARLDLPHLTRVSFGCLTWIPLTSTACLSSFGCLGVFCICGFLGDFFWSIVAGIWAVGYLDLMVKMPNLGVALWESLRPQSLLPPADPVQAYHGTSPEPTKEDWSLG